jgi:hypothetical protein
MVMHLICKEKKVGSIPIGGLSHDTDTDYILDIDTAGNGGAIL